MNSLSIFILVILKSCLIPSSVIYRGCLYVLVFLLVIGYIFLLLHMSGGSAQEWTDSLESEAKRERRRTSKEE